MPAPTCAGSPSAEWRAAARVKRDFATVDALRTEVAELGWVVRDGSDGFTLRPLPPHEVLPDVLASPDRSGRLVVPCGELPVTQGCYHGHYDTDPHQLARESRRTYDRIMARFRGRRDILVLAEAPQPGARF